jgi:hypothetical protein
MRPSFALRLLAAASLAAASMSGSPSAARIAVRPVGLGTYGGLPCCFLASAPLVDGGGRVFPAPVAAESVPLLEALFDGRSSLGGASRLVNRDGGLYDNLPWAWGRGERPKAAAFAALALRPSVAGAASPFALLVAAIREACCAEIACGYIERASLLDDDAGTLLIGATVSVRETAELVLLYGEAVAAPRAEPLRAAEVEASTDEMIGAAMAAGVPIEIERDLWTAGAVPARFTLDDGRMRIAVDAPAATDARERARQEPPRLLWELSAAEFRALQPSALARALLASGVPSLPRPRDATPDALRALARPLLDEIARNQIALVDAIAAEDYGESQRLVGARSRRQLVSDALDAALAADDLATAATLRERLDVLTDARMDPTLEEGSYDRYLDQDEWYAAEQRRIYGPKKTAARGAMEGAPAWARRTQPLFGRLPRAGPRMAAGGGGGSWFDSIADLFLGERAEGIADGGSARGAQLDSAAQLADRAKELLAEEGFDGFALRELLLQKWGQSYDVDFAVTRYLGRESLYLNVFPWTLEREPFRHADEQAYLEHLQAVSELLVKWQRVASVKAQIRETTKEPRRGTIPLKTVPLRLDLPDELVRSFTEK